MKDIWLNIKAWYWIWKHRRKMEAIGEAMLKAWKDHYRAEYEPLSQES